MGMNVTSNRSDEMTVTFMRLAHGWLGRANVFRGAYAFVHPGAGLTSPCQKYHL